MHTDTQKNTDADTNTQTETKNPNQILSFRPQRYDRPFSQSENDQREERDAELVLTSSDSRFNVQVRLEYDFRPDVKKNHELKLYSLDPKPLCN